jgi:hypothetical protein
MILAIILANVIGALFRLLGPGDRDGECAEELEGGGI